jgi:hypothetical protein
MQANVAHRLSRVQQLVGEVVDVLDHSRDGLTGASEAVQEAQRIAGALIATTETMLAATHRQIGQIVHIRRMLTAILPEEITQTPAAGKSHRQRAAADQDSSLLGLGRDLGIANPGFTAEFDVVKGEDAGASGIAPLTVPLPAVDLKGQDSTAEDTASRKVEVAPTEQVPALGANGGEARSRELSPELVEVWNLAQQMDAEAEQLERAVNQLTRELGVQTRHMRQADMNIAWFQQALEAVRGNAEQLQQLAGPNLPPPPAGEAAPPSRPLAPQERLSSPDSAGLAESTNAPATSQPRDDGTLAELASLAEAFTIQKEEPEGPATGSLRAADLLMLDDDDPLAFSFDAPGQE